MDTEIWKYIPWYEWKYQISNFGNVKSLNFNRENKVLILKNFINNWYSRVGISNNNKVKYCRVHRLVAIAFIPNLNNKPYVNHINWIKDDNRVENLEWCTASENLLHSYRILKNQPTKYWTWKKWEYHNRSKKINMLGKDLIYIKTFSWMWEASRITWIRSTWIWSCCNWKQKTAGGFIWKYSE